MNFYPVSISLSLNVCRVKGGFTALSVAVQQNHHQVATVLLEADAGSRFQLPALHAAAKKDDVKSLALLLKNKHNPNSVTKVTAPYLALPYYTGINAER